MTHQFLAARVALTLVIAAFSSPHALVRSQEPAKGDEKTQAKEKAPVVEPTPAPTHKAAYAQEYVHSFKGDRELAPEFHWHGLEPQACVEFEPDGLRINLPDGYPGKRMGTGIGINTAVKGDFEITIRYQLLKDPLEAGDATGLFLWVDLNKPKVNRGFLSRVTRKGKQFVTWYHLTREPPGKPVDVLRTYPAKESNGRLRVVRTDGVLYYYVAEGTAEDFKLLQQHAFGTEDLQAIRWGGQTGGPKASLEGRFLDLRIRADGLPELPDVVNTNQKATPEKGVAIVPAKTGVNAGWLAAGLGVGVTFLLLGAIGVAVLMRQRNAALATVSEPKDERQQTATSMAFSCAACKKRIKVRAALAGKKVKCPQCGAVAQVPTSAAVEADTPDANA